MSYAARRVVLVVCWLLVAGESVSAVRQCEDRTLESLRRALYEKSQQDATSLSELEQRVVRIATDALKNVDVRGYQFVVLCDPHGSGFAVYVLSTSAKAGDIISSIHYNITVSEDGSRVGRVGRRIRADE